MNLAKFPRRRYLVTRSPIEKLSRLSKRLGGPTLYMKRDDLLGPAGGGNKTRKLDFVVADAIEKGADTLITCGAVQSNHCRLTLAAAVQEGMPCHLVLEERVKGSYNPRAAGNNLLFHLMGVASITVVAGGSDMMAAMQGVADRVTAEGATPYIIPGGASNEIGALGICLLRRRNSPADVRGRDSHRPGGLRQRQHRHPCRAVDRIGTAITARSR